MPANEQFFWGFAGSLAVEVVTIFHILQQADGEMSLPGRYRTVSYWLVRLALAAVGGGLAIAYDIDSKILAANIGAATPAIIVALTRGPGTKTSTAQPLPGYVEGVSAELRDGGTIAATLPSRT